MGLTIQLVETVWAASQLSKYFLSSHSSVHHNSNCSGARTTEPMRNAESDFVLSMDNIER